MFIVSTGANSLERSVSMSEEIDNYLRSQHKVHPDDPSGVDITNMNEEAQRFELVERKIHRIHCPAFSKTRTVYSCRMFNIQGAATTSTMTTANVHGSALISARRVDQGRAAKRGTAAHATIKLVSWAP
jgi:hypothetical protein